MKQSIAAILLVIVCLLGVYDRLNADRPKESDTPVVVLGYNCRLG
jgi:hypothetical protein